jgi:hypothetical protein
VKHEVIAHAAANGADGIGMDLEIHRQRFGADRVLPPGAALPQPKKSWICLFSPGRRWPKAGWTTLWAVPGRT